ncbi:MAG: GAF domain-containing protein [Sphingomonas sp.]|uniref:GAF domain-containing protein n=1 Tax=Sphingomonas sp. TaxID=28214 RepID=UPI001AC28451|nr:GAF domain-containing protein [Sphingomonas sp.]MBN8808322.1 GAF domain-containing protein [Sphingomonas sp.]
MQEAERVATLKSYGILDTPNEPDFDRLVRAMAHSFGVPRALISFIDDDRQWYKARVGVAATFVPRAISFCTHSIGTDAVTVTLDARLDARFCDNPFVAEDGGVRFYAAAPIKAPNRARIGTVCVFDSSPREAMVQADLDKLPVFADQVSALLERRRMTAKPN